MQSRTHLQAKHCVHFVQFYAHVLEQISQNIVSNISMAFYVSSEHV